MNTLTRREAIMIVLPALLVPVFYMLVPNVSSWGKSVNPSSALARLDTELELARKNAPPPVATTALSTQVAKLREQLAAERIIKGKLEKQWTGLTKTYSHAAQWPEEVKGDLHQLLEAHRLQITLVQDSKAAVPGSLKTILSKMTTSGRTGRTLAVHFQGRYQDVMEALKTLSDRSMPLIPISITLDESEMTSETREWKLVVWF